MKGLLSVRTVLISLLVILVILAAACKGDTGPAGDRGPAGPQGATGAAGPVGPAGATGPAGEKGPAGPQGATGATGAAGPVGPQGATGPAGADGSPALGGATILTGSTCLWKQTRTNPQTLTILGSGWDPGEIIVISVRITDVVSKLLYSGEASAAGTFQMDLKISSNPTNDMVDAGLQVRYPGDGLLTVEAAGISGRIATTPVNFVVDKCS